MMCALEYFRHPLRIEICTPYFILICGIGYRIFIVINADRLYTQTVKQRVYDIIKKLILLRISKPYATGSDSNRQRKTVEYLFIQIFREQKRIILLTVQQGGRRGPCHKQGKKHAAGKNEQQKKPGEKTGESEREIA